MYLMLYASHLSTTPRRRSLITQRIFSQIVQPLVGLGTIGVKCLSQGHNDQLPNV